ncbi:MAG: pyrroloquinoline quinone biosynthesis peptide chaperone PqqD [Labilithrix sp.]|nr:pyrroloquinoline quinone biosynthesis peptide chaperone PqqD [Labilithrix sp.]MCW5831234.1 pyrroloquinoline quinone biosynthesis peptide chaperone PqqD [Labilithrix sp.]
MARELSFIPKLAKKARLRFDRHSGSHMIVYPERGLALNGSAAEIARRCDGTRTLGAIVDELAREAGAGADERAIVETDVVAFVELLAQRGLLEP